jgi:hypothetical protein
VTDAQRIILPARVTSFRVVCEACRASQPQSRGYVGAIVVGDLPTEEDRGSVVCRRGHEIELVRETPAAALR